AAAQKGKAESAFYPKITGSGTVQKQQVQATGSSSVKTTFAPTLDLTYKLYQFGADQEAAESAREALNAANYQYNRSLQTVVYNVAKSYSDLHTAESTIEAREASVKDAQTAYEAISRRTQAGLGSMQDLLQAKANLLAAEYELAAAHSSVETKRATLANVMGIRVSRELKIKPPTVPEKPEALSTEVERLIQRALQERPDLLANYAILKSKEHTEISSKKFLLPELDVGLSGSLLKTYNASTGRNYKGFLAVQWNIFDGFNNTYTVVQNRAQRKAAMQDLRATELSIVSDIWSNYHAFQASIPQLTAARSLEKASQEAFEAVQAGYKSGLKSLLDLLTAQSSLAEARLQKITAESNFTTSLAALVYVTGGLVSSR
ncbi:MAG: hypothetical protein A2007_05970, partial [Verrucomicrobia bacterium GWC2_42_7]